MKFYLITVLLWMFAVTHLSATTEESSRTDSLRGWEYLAERLEEFGIQRSEIEAVFRHPLIPPFESIPFSVAPRESAALYRDVGTKERISEAKAFLREHHTLFDEAEHRFGVRRSIIAALLLIETRLGSNTGNHLIFYRLARVSAVQTPGNISWNTTRLQQLGETVTEEMVALRGRFLEERFLPQLAALFTVAARDGRSVLDYRGSFAGAFGLPQFLPRSALLYGVDGDSDGTINLFTVPDAIFSTANYLKGHGWNNDLPRDELARVLHAYNPSDAYVEAALRIDETLLRSLRRRQG